MSYQNIFKRYELKYLITQQQQQKILSVMQNYMKEDAYGKSTICNIYFDLPNYQLIRHSMEKPVYKEKLRMRSYGVATPDSPVFVELKKKYKSVVYKRRIAMTEREATEYLCQRHITSSQNQIHHEIDYFFQFYKDIVPTVFLSYDREAFFSETDANFRVTFDSNILWRDYNLSLTKGIYGIPVLSQDSVLMEIKTSDAIPLWMVDVLTKEQIYKTSFSKYGTAFQQILTKTLTQTGGFSYA